MIACEHAEYHVDTDTASMAVPQRVCIDDLLVSPRHVLLCHFLDAQRLANGSRIPSVDIDMFDHTHRLNLD